MTWSRRPRIVVDTNVFVSGLVFGGVPGRIVDAMRSGRVQLVVSYEIEKEILEKLNEFGVEDEILKEIGRMFQKTAMRVSPRIEESGSRDIEDDKFLAAAKEARAEFIVTGDKDLLVMHPFGKIVIVTPKQMMEVLGD